MTDSVWVIINGKLTIRICGRGSVFVRVFQLGQDSLELPTMDACL
jgi:hypothetical protein